MTLALSAALAHPEVTAMTPAADTSVTVPAVMLTLSKPVNLRFSTFRVMAIPADKTAAQAAALGLTGVLAPEHLTPPRGG